MKLMIQVRVAYPDEFIGTFGAQARERRKAGETRYWDSADDDDRNRVCVITDWSSIESARAFWRSSKGKAQVAAWNSLHTDFTILEGQMH